MIRTQIGEVVVMVTHPEVGVEAGGGVDDMMTDTVMVSYYYTPRKT